MSKAGDLNAFMDTHESNEIDMSKKVKVGIIGTPLRRWE